MDNLLNNMNIDDLLDLKEKYKNDQRKIELIEKEMQRFNQKIVNTKIKERKNGSK